MPENCSLHHCCGCHLKIFNWIILVSAIKLRPLSPVSFLLLLSGHFEIFDWIILVSARIVVCVSNEFPFIAVTGHCEIFDWIILFSAIKCSLSGSFLSSPGWQLFQSTGLGLHCQAVWCPTDDFKWPGWASWPRTATALCQFLLRQWTVWPSCWSPCYWQKGWNYMTYHSKG